MKLPSGWNVLTLEDVCSGKLQTGPFGSQLHADEYTDEGIPVVMPKDLVAGRIVATTAARIPEARAEQLKRHRIKVGDVLFSRRGDVARAGLATKNDGGFLCGTGCLRARPDRNKALPEFLNLLIQAPTAKRWLENNAVGQTMPNMNTEILSQLTFRVPPLSEQQQISARISSWDGAIDITEQMIAAKSRYLNHLREHHLTKPKQSTRIKLKAVTHESTARNGKRLGREAIMAVTKQVGMRPMREETIAAAIDRYKVVRPNAFAYKPMRLNIGSIAISSFDDDVLVSPDYVVFECDEMKLLPGYLNHLRRTRLWASHFDAAGSGGVRIRIYYDDLAAFAFSLPPLAEQQRVLAVLDAAAAEIETLERYLTTLQKQKRGLMQKLLTGQWRVPVKNSEVAA